VTSGSCETSGTQTGTQHSMEDWRLEDWEIGVTYVKSSLSVTSQLISLRYIPGSVPFADTRSMWMDFLVRVNIKEIRYIMQ
jgi:hypothetical protein